MKWDNVNMRVLPRRMYKAQRWFLDPLPIFTHIETHLGMLFPPTYDVYVIFLLANPSILSNNVCSIFLLKSYQTLNQWENSENNRRNIVFCFSYNVYKEIARNFLQFICTWLEYYLIPRASSAIRYFSMFLCLDF